MAGDVKELNEYWAKGKVNGKDFHIKTSDVYDTNNVHKQNPHLSRDEAHAIVKHTETPEFTDGENHTQRHGAHVVKTTSNGGHFDESVEDDGGKPMNESVYALVDAIDTGSSIDIQSTFNEIMAGKIANAIDTFRTNVAKQLFSVGEEE